MFRKIDSTFTRSFCIVTLTWMLWNALRPELFNINFLYAITILCLLNAIWTSFLYKERIGYKKLWIRRAISILLDSLAGSALILLFGIVEFHTIRGHIKFFICVIIGNLILSSILFLIADQLEKRALKKINARLKENTVE